MNNEQLLEELKEISELMSNDKTIQSSENNNELNDLINKKQVLEKQISELELKLSNDANYPSFKFLENKSKLDKVKRNIDRLNLEKERNETNKTTDTTRLSEVDADIETCNELISITEKRIDEIGKNLRSLGENPLKEDEERLSSELTSKREDLDYLRSELSVFTKEKEGLTNSINSMIDKDKTVSSNLERYEELKEIIIEKDKKDAKNPVDNDKKFKDENKLSEIKSSLSALNNLIDYSKTTSQEDINVLISEIETGSVDENTIISRVKEIKEKLPASLIEKNYEEYESELELNNSKQTELSEKISELQTKLSDAVNYTPSVMAVEVMHDEISNMESIIATYDDDIKFADYSISKSQSDISRKNALIIKHEAKIEKILEENADIKFRMTDSSLSAKEYDELYKQYNKNKKKTESSRKQIDRINKNISTLETAISNMKKNKKELENMKTSDLKVLSSLKESLEDRKTIDRVKMLQDKEELQLLLAQLSVLEMQEECLNFPYYEKLNDITNNYIPENKASLNNDTNSLEPEVTSFATPGSEEKDIDKSEFESPTEFNFEGLTEPEFKEIDVTHLEDAIIETVEQPKESNSKVLSVITGWKDASSKLIEKVKNTEFVKNIKINLAKVAAVTLVTVGILGAKSLGEDEDVPAPETIETQSEVSDELDNENTDVIENTVENIENENNIVENTEEIETADEVVENEENTFETAIESEKTPDITPEETPVPTPEVSTEPIETPTVEVQDTNLTVEESNNDVNYDYPESEEIGEVTWTQDVTNNVQVNEPTPQQETATYSSELSPEEQAFLDAILNEQREIIEQQSLEQGKSR